MRDTWPLLRDSDFPSIQRGTTTTLQMNLGYLCNLACIHCHVNAGPQRKELMDRATMELAFDVVRRHAIRTLDLTGGSPEMNPEFRWLVETARAMGLHVMDRCNPTILVEPGYEWSAEFLAQNGVEVVASLPCYSAENVDQQRGDGVFEASIKALQRLNQLGYGKGDSGLLLNLVYNPVGAYLPPAQSKLELDYKRLLGERFGIVFDRLYTITNMPIKRFGSWLLSKGQFHDYLTVLKNAHRPENIDGLMCRSLVSVDYEGYIYDCDFNQMLGLAMPSAQARPHLRDLLDIGLGGRQIAVAEHCYGCTAGQGSSCGGALNS